MQTRASFSTYWTQAAKTSSIRVARGGNGARGRLPGGIAAVLAAILLVGSLGCGANLTQGKELTRFEQAGPIELETDWDKITVAKPPADAYSVVTGDVVEMYMPRIMATVKDDLVLSDDRRGYHISRVDSGGDIIVPLLDKVHVAGMNCREIEELLVKKYYPSLVKNPPSIVATVKEYFSHQVSVIGAVSKPGVYALRADQMSVTTLLSQAGGIKEKGAGVIRIRRAGGSQSEPIVLPVKGVDVEFADAVLQPGDIVEVGRLDPQLISVIGLVNKPTTIPYVPGQSYNLMQALAMGGGMSDRADPKYATVYRRSDSGEVVAARFKVVGGSGGRSVPSGANVPLKAGDVVAVEQTMMTRSRILIAEIFRVSIGSSVTPFN